MYTNVKVIHFFLPSFRGGQGGCLFLGAAALSSSWWELTGTGENGWSEECICDHHPQKEIIISPLPTFFFCHQSLWAGEEDPGVSSFQEGKTPQGVDSLSPGGLVSVWGVPGTAAPGNPCITEPRSLAPPLSGSEQRMMSAGTVGASLGHGEYGFRAPAWLQKPPWSIPSPRGET